MSANPTDLLVLRYNDAKTFRALVGATAVRPGQLLKFSSNALVPLADNDENLRVFACLEQGDIAAASTLVVPFSDCVVEMAYTGGTPAVGVDYGVTGPNTVDVANTTQLMVTVVAVNTARETVDVIEYQISG